MPEPEPKFIPADTTYLTAEELAARVIPTTPNGWRQDDERAIAQVRETDPELTQYLEARKE